MPRIGASIMYNDDNIAYLTKKNLENIAHYVSDGHSKVVYSRTEKRSCGKLESIVEGAEVISNELTLKFDKKDGKYALKRLEDVSSLLLEETAFIMINRVYKEAKKEPSNGIGLVYSIDGVKIHEKSYDELKKNFMKRFRIGQVKRTSGGGLMPCSRQYSRNNGGIAACM